MTTQSNDLLKQHVLQPVCSDCGEMVMEGVADLYWDKEENDWRIQEVTSYAWCTRCEETKEWHYAHLHDIEEPPNDSGK